jgi:hypothetical protein
MHEAGRLEHNEIILAYQEAAKLAPESVDLPAFARIFANDRRLSWESPHYYLGHYFDQQYEASLKRRGKHAPE